MVGDIIVCPADTNIVIISEIDPDQSIVSIKRSSDGGISLNNVATLLTNRLLFNPDNPDTVYAATDNGLYISANNGLTWNYWMLSGKNVYTLEYMNKALYAGTDQGTLYKIRNENPVNISGPWIGPSEIKSIYSVNNKIFIGLNGAEKDTSYNLHGSIWQSNDEGLSWVNITQQLSSTNIYGNNIITSDGYDLYAGTYGGGIFKSDGLGLSSTNNLTQSEIKIFPNPATDNIVIKLYPEQITELKLFDLSGKDLSRYLPLIYSDHQCFANIRNLPSGVYTILINNHLSKTIYKL